MPRSDPATVRHATPPPAAEPPATLATSTTPTAIAAGWPRVRGYELVGVLGRGGMGVVYQARHRELNRTVALKTLRGAALADAEFRERFQAEAAVVARLQHPNVIQVFEVGATDPRPGDGPPAPYIALEFVDGGDLSRLTGTPQPPADAAELVEKLARAAHAAHRLGVVHRDLKPANVLLTPAGEPKIADFGIAKQLSGDDPWLTRAGNAVGTPEYMAPEQVCGDRPSPAIDTYALGVILYELLTGRVPFRGVDGQATMDMVWKQDPVSPRRLQPGLPRDLETVCMRCLDKVPGRRYLTAEALADDLRRWRDGRPILARPVGPAGRAVRWAGRNPTAAGLAAAVVAVALAGLGGVGWNWREARRAAAEAHDNAAAERWARYRAEMVGATAGLRLNDIGTARQALAAAPPEHRGWEWGYTAGRLDQSIRTFPTPEANTPRWLARPGGTRAVVTAGRGATVLDMATGQRLGELPVIAGDWVCGSPDGLTLAARPARPGWTAVELWDVPAGRVRTVLRAGPADLVTAHFSPDGTLVAGGATDGTVRVWDAATGAERWAAAGTGRPTGTLAFDPAGRRLGCPGTNGGTARVWEAATGRLLHTLPVPGVDAAGFVFSPADPDLIALADTAPAHRIRLWRLSAGKPVAELGGHNNRVAHAEFSPDGRRVVTASLDQTVRLWDAATGGLVADLRERHAGKVFTARFSPDGRRLVTASQDQTVRLWDGATGAALAVLHGHAGEVRDAAFTADGAEVVSVGRDDAVRVWDAVRAERGGVVRGHTGYVYGAAFLPDGRRLASAAWDGTVRVWDADTGREHWRAAHAGGQPALALAVHPGGRWVASLGRDGFARLWDADTGAAVHAWPVPAHPWQISRLAFSPAGDRLAVGGGDFTVRLFDVATRAEVAVLRGHTGVLRDVAFSADGRWLASGSDDPDRTVRVWDLATGAEVRKMAGHTETVYALAFAPAGGLLATGSTDGTVRLWDAAAGEGVAVLQPGGPVYGLAFTPDGSRLAAGCSDGVIRLWDVARRQEVGGLTGHADYVHAVAFSPDGRRLVSASGDTTLRVWDGGPPAGRLP